jgi:chromosomal replication initiation ATPase DnaA
VTRQLAFDLPARAAYRREDLFVSPGNAMALAVLEDWRAWPGGKMLLLGPEGAGKTHLAHVWAEAAGGVIVSACQLATGDLPQIAAGGRVVVEDAERLAGDGPAEEALFHLHNMLLPVGRLLITAERPVRDWGLRLPDLQSRMAAAGVVRLEAPDDALLQAVLVKLFADRQVAVPPTLIPWLVQRMERSIAAARALVADLDARALSEGKPISRAMAAEVLAKAAPHLGPLDVAGKQ